MTREIAPIHEDAEVGLSEDVHRLGDHDLADQDAVLGRLLGDQPVASHGRDQHRHVTGPEHGEAETC